MPTPTQEDNQVSNNKDSSEEEDTNFVGRLLGREQFKLNDDFRSEVDWIVKYLGAMKGATDAMQNMCLSGNTWHVDAKTEVPNSGWRYMPSFLKQVDYTKKNSAEADSLRRLFDQLGRAEEDRYYEFFHVEGDSNVVVTANARRKEVEKAYGAVDVLIKTCNRRRKKVEKALIVRDLRDQCSKYHKAVNQLDVQLLLLSNLQNFVKDNREFHFAHFQQGLLMIQQATVMRGNAVKEDKKKRQQEKVAKEKSNKSAHRNRTVKTLKK